MKLPQNVRWESFKIGSFAFSLYPIQLEKYPCLLASTTCSRPRIIWDMELLSKEPWILLKVNNVWGKDPGAKDAYENFS